MPELVSSAKPAAGNSTRGRRPAGGVTAGLKRGPNVTLHWAFPKTRHEANLMITQEGLSAYLVSNVVTKDSNKRGPKDIEGDPKGEAKDMVDSIQHGVCYDFLLICLSCSFSHVHPSSIHVPLLYTSILVTFPCHADFNSYLAPCALR